MKILHTADWHIGQFKGPVVDGVNLRSQDTVKCLEYMVEIAREERPDIVCISGDIFHQEQMCLIFCRVMRKAVIIMSKTTFEKLGIPYEERDGIFYPVLVAGTEQTDIEAGKYGRMWIKYIKEEYPMRYKSLVRFGELEERANEVNETAYELLDDIEAKWLKKHKPENPNSFMEQLQLRTQTRMMAEEIVIMDVVMQFH